MLALGRENLYLGLRSAFQSRLGEDWVPEWSWIVVLVQATESQRLRAAVLECWTESVLLALQGLLCFSNEPKSHPLFLKSRPILTHRCAVGEVQWPSHPCLVSRWTFEDRRERGH